jgi:outer membrane protein TolC
MKRWLCGALRKLFAGGAATIVALVTLAGCQPVFMSEQTYIGAHVPLGERSSTANSDPYDLSDKTLTAAPPTPSKPDRPPRYVSLQEAIAIALENGHVSSRTGAGQGQVDNNLLSFSGQGSLIQGQTERMRVLSLNPAFASAAMEQALARNDAFFASGMSWTGIDGLAGVPNLGGSINNTSLFTQPGNSARGEGVLVKPLATGGVVTTGLIVDYRQLGNNAFLTSTGANQGTSLGLFSPQFSPRFTFGIEQPLLKDFGIYYNELTSRIPSVTGNSMDGLANNALGTRNGTVGTFVDRNSEGILISRLRFDQARAEFERNVHILMVNAEVAYWNLYDKYGQLYSFEENLRIMHAVWQISDARAKGGKLAPEEYKTIKAQYEEFRGERLRALGEVLDAERNLRGILGLPVEDGTRIVPITPPNLTELKNSWELSVQDTLKLRPELVLARENIRFHQYQLAIQYNYLKPDLRVYARYEPFGDGSTLTGSGETKDGTGTLQPNNAFRSLMRGGLADWQIGLALNVPLGWRAEFAAIRGARLQLTQAHLLLRDQEEKAVRILAEQHAKLDEWYKRIEASRSERLAYLEALTVRLEKIKQGQTTPSGGGNVSTLELLDNQRRYAAAQVKEFDAIAQYNMTLARLEFAKGTILQYNNVHISEGALPQCVQARAVEVEKERSKSIVLRERPDSLSRPGTYCVDLEKELLGTKTPTVVGGNLPSLTSPLGNLDRPLFTPPPPSVMPLPTTPPPSPSDKVVPMEFRPDSTVLPSMPPLHSLPQIEASDATLSQPKTLPARLPAGPAGIVTPEEASPLPNLDVVLPPRK